MIYTQLELFFIFIINGFGIGLLFDFFRILRKTIKTADFITYIEDILFWILTGFIILYSVFKYNDGEIRIFMFLAIIIGILLYLTLISKYLLIISTTIINLIKNILIKMFKIIKIPFTILIRTIKKIFLNPISFIIIKMKKYTSKKIKNFYNILKKMKMSNKFVKNTKN